MKATSCLGSVARAASGVQGNPSYSRFSTVIVSLVFTDDREILGTVDDHQHAVIKLKTFS